MKLVQLNLTEGQNKVVELYSIVYNCSKSKSISQMVDLFAKNYYEELLHKLKEQHMEGLI